MVSGVSTFIGGAPPFLSCHPRPPIMPGTRQTHARHTPSDPWNLSHGPPASYHASNNATRLPQGSLRLSKVPWPYGHSSKVPYVVQVVDMHLCCHLHTPLPTECLLPLHGGSHASMTAQHTILGHDAQSRTNSIKGKCPKWPEMA